LKGGTGQEETKEASRPVRASEEQAPEAWGPTRVGELIGGKYRITRLLAKGGMGVVYEAKHAVVRRRFAVKFLRHDFAGERESLGRFQREAEAAGVLESEHIASVVDFGITDEGSPYIVMEYLIGESLASLLKREGRLPYERAADLCVQACHGAEAAHAAGIVHRDLKPHNLFICRREDGTDLLKILDFGIAKLGLIKHDQVSTQTGTILGTPAYMSPEQARGERTIDRRADVYSLGAILYEMLSCRLPHSGDSPNALLFHISTQPAVPLATAVPDLPAPLVKMVDAALATDPNGRPPSAKAFAMEVGRFAKRQTWPEPPNLKTAPFPVGASSASDDASEAEPRISATDEAPAAAAVPRARARHATWAWVVVLTTVAALVVVAAVVFGDRSSRTAPAAQGDRAAPALPAAQGVPSTTGAETRPAEVVPAPALPSSPSTSARADAARPGQTKASAPRLHRGSGRPAGRPIERPTVAPVESAPRQQAPGVPAESAPAAKAAFPRPIWELNNPYGTP
jgi:serine/threonine protein kinase